MKEVEEKYCRYEYFYGNKRISADEYIKVLHEQLRSYITKEDKLREYIDKHYLWEYIKELDQYVTCEEDIKQILNEGSDE